jgi:predicted DNA-binding transcriptional regulator YafY
VRSDGRLFWVRAIWFLDRLERGLPTTASDIAEHFSISRGTAYRLCDSLRDDFGAPLEFDRSTSTWSLTDPHWELPRLPLSPGEVTALAFARGLVSHVTAPGIADDMSRFWSKLSMELASQSPDGVAC